METQQQKKNETETLLTLRIGFWLNAKKQTTSFVADLVRHFRYLSMTMVKDSIHIWLMRLCCSSEQGQRVVTIADEEALFSEEAFDVIIHKLPLKTIKVKY